MPNWTSDQQLAIEKENTNIIVSAGAGSGKTAVLSERVIRKLEQNIDIDRLLILTFTKAAAFEMMIRIRDKIKKKPHLKKQLDKIDMAYITTFDAFSLSLVKKYHDTLKISKDIRLIDQNIMNIEKKKILEDIFEQYYQEQNPKFLRFLNYFTWKDDTEIKQFLLNIDSHISLKYNKKEYLENYVRETFNPNTQEKQIQVFETFLMEKLNGIQEQFEKLSNVTEENYSLELETLLNPLLKSNGYDEIVQHFQIPKKNLPKNSSEEAKQEKEELWKKLKELETLLNFKNKEEIKLLLMDTKEDVEIIIQILQEFDDRISAYKSTHNAYEFIDVSKMAIKLVKENEKINQELKELFLEIMVDEYQDTSDLQEEFIASIANNNVYMVGDIKQSIYRFRNANPYIFKEKYNQYKTGTGGFKIDLVKNFRSRKEVLENINQVFDDIMTEDFGGCRYKEEHQMVFGNQIYEWQNSKAQDSNFEIYNYLKDKEVEFSKEEIEAFIVAQDIEQKIKNKYQVLDKKTEILRDCNYSDFTILIDTAKSFEIYKKIFEYKNIPLAVYKETSITKEDDIYILSNLLKLIYLIYHKQYDEEFRYVFLSVSRSYLTDEDDTAIFKILAENKYNESEIIKKLTPILKEYHELNGVCFLEKIIDTLEIYEKQIQVGKMEALLARLSYLKTLFEEMGMLGYSLDEMILNFNQMVTENYKIEVSLIKNEENAVKIMTIHKSKGLEFPILYMTGLSNRFNMRELNEKILFDSQFGIITPFYKDSEITHILKPIIKQKYIHEEISEKIRLFYVALTRAKEKMILITCNLEEENLNNTVLEQTKYKYRSFLDILKSIWYRLEPHKKEVDIQKLNLSKKYNFLKENSIQEESMKLTQPINYREIQVSPEFLDEQQFSKKNEKLMTKEEYQTIELGRRFHQILEEIDFKNPCFLSLTDFERKHIEAFFMLPILKNIKNAKVYKEYEFILEEKNIVKHGIIDLLIEEQEKIIIIDYKLKQTNDEAYNKQLKGYQNYVKTKTNKIIEVYLYSILEHQLKKI